MEEKVDNYRYFFINTENSVRLVAVFEFLKGLLVFLVGLGMISFLEPSLMKFLNEIVSHFHLDPAKNTPDVIIVALTNPTQSELLMMGTCALIYTFMRIVEAFGLWFQYEWAQWLGLSTAFIYIPFEIVEIIQGNKGFGFSFLFINIFVIAILSFSLWKKVKLRYK